MSDAFYQWIGPDLPEARAFEHDSMPDEPITISLDHSTLARLFSVYPMTRPDGEIVMMQRFEIYGGPFDGAIVFTPEGDDVWYDVG